VHALANPTRFLRIARPATTWLLLVGLALAIFGMAAGLTLTPPDYLQGETVRILYIHVPSAWLGMAGWMAIAAASGAHYVRVNVHMGAVVGDQGIIQGSSQFSMRLRSALKSSVLVFADVGVKHAAPLAGRTLDIETRDVAERGLADAIIVTGDRTGVEADLDDISVVRRATNLPVLVGSGATPENIARVLPDVDGLIVGSYFKKDGAGRNFVEPARVERFVRRFTELRG